MIYYEYIVKIEKMLDTAKWMRRCFNIAVWLSKRYNIKGDNCQFDYYFTEGQKEDKLVTIRFTFYE